MRSIDEVLDAVKARHGLASDYKLAQFLGMGDANVRNYRHGRSLPDERAVQKIADALGEPPYILLAEIQAQRAHSDEARGLWERMAEQLKHVRHAVATVMLVMGLAMLFAAPSPQGAQAATTQTPSAAGSLCILCK
jgi:transcriptional regulator with XRE-family HTH domain